MANYQETRGPSVLEMLTHEYSINALIKDRYDDGIKKGIEEGIEVSYRNVAIKMIKANKSDLEIHEMTELPLREIQKLRDDNVNNI